MNNVTRTVNCRCLFLTLSVLAALALASAPAQAKPPENVSCGQTLTHSVKLANDLTNCPNNGLVVGADDVTVDLNGHTIDGDGASWWRTVPSRDRPAMMECKTRVVTKG